MTHIVELLSEYSLLEPAWAAHSGAHTACPVMSVQDRVRRATGVIAQTTQQNHTGFNMLVALCATKGSGLHMLPSHMSRCASVNKAFLSSLGKCMHGIATSM